MSRHNPEVFVFLGGLERAKNLCGIYAHSRKTFSAALNCDDLLRSSIVTSFSALDLLVHSIAKKEILHRYTTKSEVRRLVVPFNFFVASETEIFNALDAHITDAHGHKSFMAPDKIAEVLSYFVEEPWAKVAVKLGQPESAIKSRLRELVRWRNRIVHEQDINPTYGGIELWPIVETDVQAAIAFLDQLGPAIGEVISEST